MTLKHSYNSTVAEDSASGTPGGLVGPNEWNADHAVSGTSLQTLFNNAGSLTGMSGTSWDNTNLALTITGATITAPHPVLNLSQTWNNNAVTFTGLLFNVTNTASANFSKLLDLQVGGSTFFAVDVVNGNAALIINTSGAATTASLWSQALGELWYVSGIPNGSYTVALVPGGLQVNNTSFLGIGPDALGANPDATFSRYGAHVIGLSNNGAAGASGFQVYNTVDGLTSPTNYERGVFDWTTSANVLTIGTQAGGTGNSRAVQFVGLDFVHGASVATNATDGFLYIPSCAGTPTGTPTTFTGTVPMVYDRTNNKFYIYNSGWKGGTVPGTFS